MRGVAQSLSATAPDQLEAITALIHDAHFDEDEVAFDEEQRTLTIPFQQEDETWGDRGDPVPWEHLRTTRWYYEYRVPFYRGQLTVHHVTAFEGWSESDAPSQLVKVTYDTARRQVIIDDWEDNHVSVERLAVTAELTDEVVRNMRRRCYRLLHAERDVPM